MSNTTARIAKRSVNRASAKAAKTDKTDTNHVEEPIVPVVSASSPAALAAPSATPTEVWIAPAFLTLIRNHVEQTVPRGEAAGDNRGKGITPRMLLVTIGQTLGFEQPVETERTDDAGKPMIDEETGLTETYLRLGAAGQEAEAMFGFYLRSGTISGLVARKVPLGGYGWAEDAEFWKLHPITQREFGPRARKYMGFPIVYVREVGEAIKDLLPKPASFTLRKGTQIPVNEKGEELPKMVSVRDVANKMFQRAIAANPSSAATVATVASQLLGSSAENNIRLCVKAGIVGTLGLKGGIFWLESKEADQVIADMQDTNVFDKDSNPTGNKKAGNTPHFSFLDPPSEKDIEKAREMLDHDGYASDAPDAEDLLTFREYMRLIGEEEGEGEGEDEAPRGEAKSEPAPAAPASSSGGQGPAPAAAPSAPAPTVARPRRLAVPKRAA